MKTEDKISGISTMEFESRIIEVVLKDGSKEYFPQIRFECDKEKLNKSVSLTNDGWMWLSEGRFSNKYELRENDHRSLCKNIDEAIEKINKFKKQREEIDEDWRLYFEKEILRKNSIKETNVITKF